MRRIHVKDVNTAIRGLARSFYLFSRGAPVDESQSDDANDIIRAFADVRATAPSRAMAAREIGVAPGATLQSLVDRGVLRSLPGDPDRLYLTLLDRGALMPRWVLVANLVVVLALGTAAVALMALYFIDPRAFHSLVHVRR